MKGIILEEGKLLMNEIERERKRVCLRHKILSLFLYYISRSNRYELVLFFGVSKERDRG